MTEWTWEKVDAVAQKQSKAITLVTDSPLNTYGLSRSEVALICESKRPRQSGGVFWIGERHEAIWREMRDLPLDDLVSKFGQEIQNRRILEAVLGD